MGVDAAELKKQAAAYAVDLVQSGMIVGLGHGSTAIHVVGLLAEKLKSGQLKDVIGVPSSYQVEEEAMRYGLPLRKLDENPMIDLTIDGADEVDPQAFWQIHRSALVSVKEIAGVNRDMRGHLTVRLKQRPETLPVGENYVHLFRQM